MNDTIRSAVLGVLAILAVAYAAVTLDSAVVEEREPPGSGPGDGGGGLLPPPPAEAPASTIQIPYLAELFTIVIVLGLIGLIILVVMYWRTALGLTVAALAVIGLIYIIAQYLTFSPDMASPPMMDGNESVGDNGGNGDPGAPTTPVLPPWVYLLFLALLGVIGLVYLNASSRGVEAEEVPDTGDTAASVGRAAGRAADRIETESDLDNEIYRAWREMTELLEVDDPETSTPGEFALAATEAGLGRQDVGELTRLFEDVRYGGSAPTADDERRAVAVLRRIEDRYTAEEDT